MSVTRSMHRARFKMLTGTENVCWELGATELSSVSAGVDECRAPTGEGKKKVVASIRKPGPARAPVDFADWLNRDLEIVRLKREVERLNSDAVAIGVELLQELIAFTSELFAGTVALKQSFDPEYANDKYMVVIVYTRLDPEDAFAAEKAWIQKVGTITTAWKDLRLSVRFK